MSFELLLCSFRKGREELFEGVLELRRNTRVHVVAPLLLSVPGELFVGWVCAAALSTVRISPHETPVEDPSAAKLSRAFGPAAGQFCLLVRHIVRPCP